MSLIYGIKTQYGVYLASDTRLTNQRPSGILTFEDDFCKFHTFGKHVHLAAAGNASLASYLIQKIHKTDLSDATITRFRDEVEDIIRTEIGVYPYVDNKPSVVFICAGHDPDRKDEVNMDKVIEFTQFMQGNTGSDVPVRLLKPMREAFFKCAQEQRQGKIVELDSPFIGLFSIEIQLQDHGVEIIITDSEWAGYLMFGPNGLTAKDAPPELVVQLDLGRKAEGLTKQDVIFENTSYLINFFYNHMIPKHQLQTVGGAIFTAFINQWGALFPEGEMGVIDAQGNKIRKFNHIVEHGGKFCTKIGEDIKPLRRLVSFYKSGSMDLGKI